MGFHKSQWKPEAEPSWAAFPPVNYSPGRHETESGPRKVWSQTDSGGLRVQLWTFKLRSLWCFFKVTELKSFLFLAAATCDARLYAKRYVKHREVWLSEIVTPQANFCERQLDEVHLFVLFLLPVRFSSGRFWSSGGFMGFSLIQGRAEKSGKKGDKSSAPSCF